MKKCCNFYSVIVIIVSLTYHSILWAQWDVNSNSGNDGTLPVELIYFEAHILSDGVFLRWGTATEVSNFGFNIERADTSKLFEAIGFVPGSGNSNSPKHYTFKDSSLTFSGNYFYRLKQIDTDGTSKFSDTLVVNYGTSSTALTDSDISNFILYQNFPNPFNAKTNLRFKVGESGSVNIYVYDILGNFIETPFTQYLYPGEFIFNYDAGHLSSGNYLLSIRQNNSEKRIKLTLLK